MRQLREEMSKFYQRFMVVDARQPAELAGRFDKIAAVMDAHAALATDEHPYLLKARLHEEIAEQFEPQIFPHSPFFYEMGLRASQNWGNPDSCSPGSWMRQRNHHICREGEPWGNLYHFDTHVEGIYKIWNGGDVFDVDHHCIGYTDLLAVGLNGILDRIDSRLQQPASPDQQAYLHAARRSAQAMLKIAGKFGRRAEEMLTTQSDPQVRTFLEMIVQAAARVPALPPRTFYEGLAMLWFLREVMATMENIGISVLGHLDRQLIDLYRADIAAGRITEKDAAQLLAIWMTPTDIKFHADTNAWPETSTCIELGGCDADGVTVFNELTRLIIRVHKANGFINPKLNCRISASSPQEYLDIISQCVLEGHNVFALLNDDVLIKACIRSGKKPREARLYVNGGCQETIVEGVEHSAGAYYYFNMVRVLDLCLQPAESRPLLPRPQLDELAPSVIEATDFESFYRQFIESMTSVISAGARWRAQAGSLYWKIHPCPLFSATLADCIENANDYTAGGARYNPSGIALIGLATVVDSLYAIRKAVFEEKWLTLAQLRSALADNWNQQQNLRARLTALPKFGHGDEDVDALAKRFSEDLYSCISALRSERGGNYQGSFFVYYFFKWMGEHVRATPDGRAAKELLSQGCAPARVQAPGSLTDAIRSLRSIDFANFPGNAVLDVQLPITGNMKPAKLSSIFRTFCQMGGPTIQPNAVKVEQLRDARTNPQQHKDLMVRVSGLSARFVALAPDVQNEIIDRAMMAH